MTQPAKRPPKSTLIPPDSVRTVFLSDVHLGSKHCRAEEVLALLNRVRPRDLYLVGDFLDGWKLARRWRWSSVYNDIIERLIALGEHGTRLHYTPGNHDEFLRTSPIVHHLKKRGLVTIEDQFIHEAVSGERFLILHGDQFDSVEQGASWLTGLADIIYDGILSANYLSSRLLRWQDGRRYRFSRRVKQTTKKAVRYFSKSHARVIARANEFDCVGIVSGHTHMPNMVVTDEVTCINTGDWVENCTYLVEYEDGRMALEWFFEPEHRIERRPPQWDNGSDDSAVTIVRGEASEPVLST